MKKMLALLLSLVMCISMAACGSSQEAPAASPTTSPAASAADAAEPETEATQPEPEATEPSDSLALLILSADEAEEYYQAIMSGDVSGEGAEFIKQLDENTAKLYLDVLAEVFGSDVLGTLTSFSGIELDQVMTEITFIVERRSASAQEEEEEYFDEALYEAANNGTATTLELYNAELSRRLFVTFDLAHVFLEPGWVMTKDDSCNYFISLDNYGEVYTLDYRTEYDDTQRLMQRWGAQYATDGKVAVSKIETFTAGGVEWEMFAFVYDRESSGIDKETGELVTSVSTVYSPYCFARLDNETILMLNTGTSVSEDIMDYYKNLLQESIVSITATVG